MRNREILKNQSQIFVKFIKKIGFNFNVQNKKNFKYTVKAFQGISDHKLLMEKLIWNVWK